VLGWEPNEYRQATKSKLLRQKVAYQIDKTAEQKQGQASTLLKDQNADLEKVAAQLGGSGDTKVTAGISGLVPKTNRDGGLSTAAAKLQVGQISPVIKTTTGDGYYFVKLLDKSDSQINYSYIRIPLTTFNKQLAQLKKNGKVHEYISVPSADSVKADQSNQ